MGTVGTYDQLRLYVRELMNSKKIKVPDLARELNISTSGMRKILTRSDISYKALEQILEALGSSMERFFEEKNSQSQHEELNLNPELDEYLSTDLIGFLVFWLCAIERRKIDDIADKINKKRLELYKTLRKLDHFKVIKWKKGDEILSEFSMLLKLPKNSHLRTTVENCFFTVPFFKSVQRHLDPSWKWRIWCLNAEQIQEFREELEALCMRYARISALTMRTSSMQELSTVRMVWRFEPFDVVAEAVTGFEKMATT